jgi:hypothetical protein
MKARSRKDKAVHLETIPASELQDGDYFVSLPVKWLFRVIMAESVGNQVRRFTFYSPCRPEIVRSYCHEHAVIYRVTSMALDAADEICGMRGDLECHHVVNVLHLIHVKTLLHERGYSED